MPLVRSKERSGVYWDPEAGVIDHKALEGCDAVINLAGENIASGRWTADRKRRILNSRVKGTTLLCDALGKLDRRPSALLSASAIGYYGDRGSEVLREDSAPGSDFLADVCRQWEKAADGAAQKGIRVIKTRIGVVLSTHGGALAKMLPPFKLGVGGRVGSGAQYMSWITIDDLTQAFLHCLNVSTLSGPINLVAPAPVTNAEFTKSLGRVLGRPTVFPAPGFALRIAFGEMADALLLSSTRVEPAKLAATGFRFQHRSVDEGLRAVLGS